MESIWNAQTGALAVERMCWSAVEIACSWKPCSGTHTFERSQWNHIETEALPMNVNHHQVEDLALQNLGNSWNACNGTHVLQHMLYVWCSFTLSAAALLLSCPTDASDRLWDLMWLLPTRPLRNLMWLLLKRTTATQPGDELRATKPALRAC